MTAEQRQHDMWPLIRAMHTHEVAAHTGDRHGGMDPYLTQYVADALIASPSGYVDTSRFSSVVAQHIGLDSADNVSSAPFASCLALSSQLLSVLRHLSTAGEHSSQAWSISHPTPFFPYLFRHVDMLGSRRSPISWDALEQGHYADTETNVFYLTQPNNPCGRSLSVSAVERLIAHCERSGATLVVNELHRGIGVQGEVDSILKWVSPDAPVLVVSGITKSHNACLVGGAYLASRNKRLFDKVKPLLMDAASPASSLQLHAMSYALSEPSPWVSEQNRELFRRRVSLSAALRDLGVRTTWKGKQSQFFWADLRPLLPAGAGAQEQFLRAGIRVSPGPLFGASPTWARINLAISRKDFVSVIDRLGELGGL